MTDHSETRLAKITSSLAGGTASAGSKTYKISLPSSWVNTLDTHDVVMSFDGERITITPRQDAEQFKNSRLSKGHSVLEIRYYDKSTLCSLIYADETTREIYAKNYSDIPVKTALGIKANPSWKDLEEFIESRCIPRSRAGLQHYLDVLGISAYDPWDIVKKTQGRMAEDEQWLEITEL